MKRRGTTRGRMTSGPNLQTLPRDVICTDLGKPEPYFQFIECHFPGYDAIGADIFVVNYGEMELRTMAQLSRVDKDTPVIYAATHRGRVLEVLPKGQVKIKFDETFLIPPVMDVPASQLEWYLDDGTTVNFSVLLYRCPKCDVPWKERPGFRFNFFDCPVCGGKRDQHAG